MSSSATISAGLLSRSFQPSSKPSWNTNGGLCKIATKRKSSPCRAWCLDAKANAQVELQDGLAFNAKANAQVELEDGLAFNAKANAQVELQDGLAFKQNFFVHSYSVGPDGKATPASMVHFLLETAFNHLNGGKINDDFNVSPDMTRNNLLWVITNMQFTVERYPIWGDTVEVDTWNVLRGKNRVHVNWFAYDSKTKQTIMRASSLWMPMNKATRRLSRLPEEVRANMSFVDRAIIVDEDNRKLQKLSEDTADYVKRDITPEWSDLDVNRHVNNVKYISWILKSSPMWINESHELAAMTLQYRKECLHDSVVESLIRISSEKHNLSLGTGIECEHMLQLEGGVEVTRSRTYWRPK